MDRQRGIVMVYFTITWSVVVFLAVSRVEGTSENVAYDPYFHVGCYKEDTNRRALPILLANYSRNDNNIIKIRNCADKAASQYQAFGLQNNGECWSGFDALFAYAKYGADSSCANGVGGVKANDVYILSLKFSHLGCYKEDPADRAMPVLVAYINASDPNPIQSCARAAWKSGFSKVFGLQDDGDCWSGNDTDDTYYGHGAARPCGPGGGTGGHLKIEVYRIDTSLPTTSVPQSTVIPAAFTPTTEARTQPGYHRYGCFKEENEGSFSSSKFLRGGVVGKVPNRALQIRKCAKAALKSGYQAFGFQENAKCVGWEKIISLQYLEQANDCEYGMGKQKSYNVYIFNKFTTIISTPSSPRRTGTQPIYGNPKTHTTVAPSVTVRVTVPHNSTSRRSTVYGSSTTRFRSTTHKVTKTQTTRKPTQRTTENPASRKSTVYGSSTTRFRSTTHKVTKTQTTRKPTQRTTENPASRKSTVYGSSTTRFRSTTHKVTKTQTTRKPTQRTTENPASRKSTERRWSTEPRPTTNRTLRTRNSRDPTRQTTPAHKKILKIPYRHIGCFEDKNDRAMPELLGHNWTNGKNASIERCARLAWNKGYQVFGVQYYGRECWSGVNAGLTYAKYGNSTNCSNDIGGDWANDVYAFVPCLPGKISQGSLLSCQPCPVNTYQHKIKLCKPCESGKKTWGRKAVPSNDNCTAKNPIQVSSFEVNIPPDAVRRGSIVANFSASFEQGSLVIPPLTYTMTGVTRSPSQPRTSDVTSGDLDSCSQPVRNSSFPFCIYRNNGSIAINKNFSCSEGDKFVININVSDSGNDTIGTIINPDGRVTINCVDVCKGVRLLYENATKACPKPNITVQINDTRNVVVNSTNIYSIEEMNVTNIAGNSCSTFNVSMTHGLVNVTSDIVRFGNIEGQTSVGYRFENPIIVTGPAINITMLSNNCIESASLALVTVPKHRESCGGSWECLDAVFNWTNSTNVRQCGSDPDNLRVRYGHCVVQPNISSEPESKSVSSGAQVTLSCDTSGSPPVSITWYRGANSIPTNNVTMNVSNQGYYWCEARNRYGTAESAKALLVVSDYFTSIISFKLKGNNPKKNSQSPCQSCQQIAGYLKSQDSPREYKHNPTCRHWKEGRNEIRVECVIHGEKKDEDEDLDSYYRNLDGFLTEGAKKNKIENLKISWKSILVKDTGMCLKETTGKQNIKGVFTWELTRIGRSATVTCPPGTNAGFSATRRCVGNFNTGAVWDIPDDVKCSYKSKKTEAMNKLSKIKLNPRNVNEAAKNFTKMFKSGSAKDMSEADANLAADMVDNILSVEDRLNQTADAVVQIIDIMMNMNSSSLKANTSSRTIKALDKIAEKIPLEGDTTSKVLNSSNLVIQANKVNATTFKGLGFGISKDRDGGKSFVTNDDQTSLFVKLPRAVVKNANKSYPARIGCIYFANNILFAESGEEEESEDGRKPSDEVMSSSVYNADTSQLSENVTLSFPGPERRGSQNSSCVYWDEEARRWSDQGCSLCSDSDSDNEGSVKCCCNHLTSFAVLFSPEPLAAQDKKHEKILSIISYVGCGISLAGVVLTFLTYSLFRHLRKTNQQPILMSLCVAIAFLLIVFAVGVERTTKKLGCQVVAVLLHYFSLATILWMGVEAYNLYLQLVKVMAIYHRKFMLKASLFAWGVPALIVTATVVAAVIQYNANENSNRVFYYGNDDVCILHEFTYRMVSWFAPILVIILFNLVMFILVTYKLNCTGAMVPVDTKSNQKKRCWTALAIMSLLGITWLFGALAISSARLVFEYLFCIFNSLQGFFIFFFHCVRIKEVRNQWSFFVSGLGFSHRDSETSHQRSRGIGESHHSSDAPYVKVKNWILRKESNSDQPKRKITVTTDIDDKNVHAWVCDENKVDMELHEVRDIDPHENDALEDSGHFRRDSRSSKRSSNP